MSASPPTPDVSLVDLTVTTAKPVSDSSVNAAFKSAADGPMKGILQYSEEPLVSAEDGLRALELAVRVGDSIERSMSRR